MRNGFLMAALVSPLLIVGSVRAENAYLGGEDPVFCESPTSNWSCRSRRRRAQTAPGLAGRGCLSGPPEFDITPGHDFTVSPRIWLAWDNAEGLGVRIAYWTINADATQNFANPVSIFGVDVLGTRSHLAAQTFDFEATQRGCLGHLQFQLSGGFRYAKMDTGLGVFGLAPAPFDAGIGMDFQGFGPTVAMDVTRPIGSRGLALVGGVRSSWIYGQTDFGLTGDLAGFPVNVYADDHMMQINEVNLGIEWSRCFDAGRQGLRGRSVGSSGLGVGPRRRTRPPGHRPDRSHHLVQLHLLAPNDKCGEIAAVPKGTLRRGGVRLTDFNFAGEARCC